MATHNEKQQKNGQQARQQHQNKSMPETAKSMPATPRTPYQCEFQSLVVFGCHGCEALLEKINLVRKAWRQKWANDMKNADMNWEKLKMDHDRLDSDIKKMRTELEEEQQKRQQKDHEYIITYNNLLRAKALIDRNSMLRQESFSLLEQLVQQHEHKEHQNDNTSNNNNNNHTNMQVTPGKRKEFREAEVQTTDGHLGLARIAHGAGELAIHKTVKRLARKRIELARAIEFIQTAPSTFKRRPSSSIEENVDGSAAKKAFSLSNGCNGTIEEKDNNTDDDDIIVVEVKTAPIRTHLPSTPPMPTRTPVKMSGTVSGRQMIISSDNDIYQCATDIEPQSPTEEDI